MESKELYSFKKKSADLLTFQERATRRVNWDYTQHIIKSGNAI